MRLGMGVPKTVLAPRREARVPIEMAVQISGHAEFPETETTFTENVSARGARVWTAHPWKAGAQLILSTLPGSFRSVARVAYCQSVRGTGYAVGVEFVEYAGTWIISAETAT